MKCLVLTSCLTLLVGPAVVQSQTAGSGWTVPRTSDGTPDFQGFWTIQTYTPLERPERFAGRELLTEEEFAELTEILTAEGVDPLGARRAFAADNDDERVQRTRQADPTHYDNSTWLRTRTPKGLSSRRTSLIVDPPDGQIPSLTPGGEARAAARAERRGFDSYQNRPYQERCLVWNHEGPPMTPPPYNDLYQIFQAPGYLVLLPELTNNPVRIIPTDGRPHVSERIRQWPGNSRGRWDGVTLVVETRNFTDRSAFRGSSSALRVVERFTQIDPDTIRYQFTVEDETSWARPRSAEIPMTRTDGPLYEYACHEGNYGMRNTMRGARRADRDKR